MTDINHEVAIKVMKWRRVIVDGENGWDYEGTFMAFEKAWSPSTDPAADYEVLVYARENWNAPIEKDRENQYDQFLDALSSIWKEREGFETVYGFAIGAVYEVGDYARAALAATEE